MSNFIHVIIILIRKPSNVVDKVCAGRLPLRVPVRQLID